MTDSIQAQIEQMWQQKEYENALIATYVPEADTLTREEALILAKERNEQAAQELEFTAKKELDAQYLKELGF
jgi:hypothetical protein